MPERDKDFLTPQQVADAEGVHVASVRRWIKQGLLPCWRSPGGRTIRIPTDYRDETRANAPPSR